MENPGCIPVFFLGYVYKHNVSVLERVIKYGTIIMWVSLVRTFDLIRSVYNEDESCQVVSINRPLRMNESEQTNDFPLHTKYAINVDIDHTELTTRK